MKFGAVMPLSDRFTRFRRRAREEKGEALLDYRVHTFLAVCREGSYTRAAETLLITQPAVSQHIRQLEQHYGCALFTKTGRGMEPTPAGELLYRALDTLENDEARLELELQALTAGATSRAPLRFGCTRTIADYVAPAVVSGHLSRHPDERIVMHTGNTAELVALIDAGTIDFALVEGSYDRSAFDSVLFSTEPYVAVAVPDVAERCGRAACQRLDSGVEGVEGGAVSDGVAATGRDAASGEGAGTGDSGDAPCPERRPDLRPRSIAELLPFRLILREQGSGTREILEKHLAARDLSPDDFAGVLELASIPAIKACVRAGAGISFLYRVAVEQELAAGELVDITPGDFAIEHDFALIWQRGSRYANRYRALARSWSR